MDGITRKRFLDLGLGVLGAGLFHALGCDDATDTTVTTGPGGVGGGQGGNPSAGGSTSDGGNGGNPTGGGQGGQPTTGGNGGTGGSAGACAAAVTAVISQNHDEPHALTIPLADIITGVDTDYETTGSDHCHTITVTAADFLELQAGNVVVKHSCNGTNHEFVLSCAPSPPPGGNPNCTGTPNLGECN